MAKTPRGIKNVRKLTERRSEITSKDYASLVKSLEHCSRAKDFNNIVKCDFCSYLGECIEGFDDICDKEFVKRGDKNNGDSSAKH